MPDDIITDAAKEIIGISIVGPICIILVALLWWREKVYRTDLKFWQDKYQASQDAHLKDVRDFATSGEAMKNTMGSLVTAVNANMEALKERPRR